MLPGALRRGAAAATTCAGAPVFNSRIYVRKGRSTLPLKMTQSSLFRLSSIFEGMSPTNRKLVFGKDAENLGTEICVCGSSQFSGSESSRLTHLPTRR